MAAPTLIEMWRQLDDPSGKAEWIFSTVPIAHLPNLRLGKGPKGPAVLIDHDPTVAPAAPIRLANIHAWFGVDCVVESRDGAETRLMDVVVCTSPDGPLRALFLNAAEQLLVPSKLPGAMPRLIADLVELFRALRDSPKGSVSGLWGELFVIWSAPDVDPLVDAWHTDPNEVFDFGSSSRRLEVKTSLGDRRHHFSLEQVTPPHGVTACVVSILTRTAVSGPSILELVSSIASRSGRADTASRLINAVSATLGSESPHISESRFDEALAAGSICVYDTTEVPRPISVPAEVSAVKFVSDLSKIAPIAIEPWQAL